MKESLADLINGMQQAVTLFETEKQFEVWARSCIA